MEKIKLLCFKDLKILLKSPSLWILLALSSIIWGVLFSGAVFRYVESLNLPFEAQKSSLHWAVVSQHIFYTHFILLFFIPAFTMRAFTDEKKNKTFELLLTSPITSYQIVISKFLTSLVIVLLFLVISLTPFIWLTSVTEIQLNLFWSSFLGLFLVSSVYITIALISSALTRSHFVSFFTAILLNIFILMMGDLSYSVDAGIWREVLDHMALERHFISLMRGAVEIKSLVFLVSLIGFFLFLSDRMIESERWR